MLEQVLRQLSADVNYTRNILKEFEKMQNNN